MLNKQGDVLQKHGDILLNTSYWDCECEYNYIHKKKDILWCCICDSYEGDCPDSREPEVQELIYNK